MKVIPSGFNFNFLLPGLLKYIACMLVLGFAGAVLARFSFGWAPKSVRNTMTNIAIATGMLSGLYIGALLNQ